jgi:hypothetical protein
MNFFKPIAEEKGISLQRIGNPTAYAEVSTPAEGVVKARFEPLPTTGGWPGHQNWSEGCVEGGFCDEGRQ